MSVLRGSYGQRALPAHGFSAHAACSLVRAARTSYPRGHGGGTEDVEVGDTSLLTSLSIDGEYTSDTLSERRGSILPASVSILMKVVLQKRYRGLSRLVFDLPPNPSIDHLVAVILKYPRREESGRRKSLNPGPTG